MAVESASDLLAFFDEGDFASSAVITLPDNSAVSLTGIFEDPRASRSVTQHMDVMIPDPSFTCRTVDLSTASEGDTITINSNAYIIRALATDGTGVSTLQLEEA